MAAERTLLTFSRVDQTGVSSPQPTYSSHSDKAHWRNNLKVQPASGPHDVAEVNETLEHRRRVAGLEL